MDQPEQLYRDFQALQERLSLLSQASLRINESLDFDAVFQGALDSARSLTGARHGVLYQLSAQAPNVLNHGLLLRRVCGPEHVGKGWLLRNVVKKLRRKLGDDAAGPRYIFTEPRVGYRMAGEAEAMDDSAGFSGVELPAQLE